MKPIVLIILDGWGISQQKKGNAILNGKIPFIDFVRMYYPTCKLKASGEAVGLPAGYQGNSEVGHINIGAGRVVYQMLEIINRKIKDGSFFHNKALLTAINNCKKHNSTLHLMGLVSDEGVHSHQNHLFSLLKLAAQHKIKDVVIHVFTDGRDTLPQSAAKYISEVEKQIAKYKVGRIVTISGRYYAMDRDNRWDRIKKAYLAISDGNGKRAKSWREVIKQSYSKKINDEFILPTVLNNYSGVKDNDSIIFFNYRLDRARQLTHAFTDKHFLHFKRNKKKIIYCAFTPYYKDIVGQVAFEEPKLTNILAEVVSKHNLKQFRIAETEKYAHVTFFFNAERDKAFSNEDRFIIPSPKVAKYDEKPEMSAFKITDKIVEVVKKDLYDVIIVNYANGDMIGHTGNYKAALKAVEVLNECVKQVYKAVEEKRGCIILAADHGNCEAMIDLKTGKPHTSHTKNDVPCSIIGVDVKLKENGKLADIAPTILALLEIKQPKEMSGQSLILK